MKKSVIVDTGIFVAYLNRRETLHDWVKKQLADIIPPLITRIPAADVCLQLSHLKFIDWIMTLPKELEKEIFEEIKTIEEKTAMPHITTAERIGMERGIEKGVASMHHVIVSMIKTKFGESGSPLIERAQHVKHLPALEELSEKIMQAQNLAEAMQVLDELEMRVN